MFPLMFSLILRVLTTDCNRGYHKIPIEGEHPKFRVSSIYWEAHGNPP